MRLSAFELNLEKIQSGCFAEHEIKEDEVSELYSLTSITSTFNNFQIIALVAFPLVPVSE